MCRKMCLLLMTTLHRSEEKTMSTQLDELMSSAFEKDHPAMLDYVQLKFKIKELKKQYQKLLDEHKELKRRYSEY